ncbi:hypothetical protein G3N58_17660 [Paraburkholderia sp. Ac-20342]|uniref:hypothetical protein n=1 Tax=Paraburkholderia sp. Ac-20342 TaxID=2703889 RepID=UPI00197CEC69|nr:hypothetical protein [Paraburkholderia sp. Ac-20342]MBN3848635.1 hypothetical protein [Paraburkholderia sp. Ac-20342]
MTTRKKDFGFHLGKTVNIVDAGIRARIDVVMDSLDGIQYRICFWSDGCRRIEWVYANEIESLQKESLVHPHNK